MDAIDILGTILGHKSSGKGRGADVLRDILRGGPQASPRPRQPRATPPASPPRGQDLARQAKELEDLLNVAGDRATQRRETPRPPRPSRQDRTPEPSGSPAGGPDDDSGGNERAVVLIRAMVNAAKSDGQVSREEQQAILQRLGDASPEAIQFLREEFSRPLDLPQFASSVPIGMEQQVYTMSLIAIDLDTGKEAEYLKQLSEVLRIPTDVREQIHERLDAPSIY